VIKQQKRA